MGLEKMCRYVCPEGEGTVCGGYTETLLRHQFKSRRRSGGFTLVELIATIVVMGIMAAVGSSVISDTFTTVNIINRNQVVSSEARYAMERIAREIREMQYSGSAYVISSMTATNMVFTKGDGAIVTLNNSGANLTIAYSTLSGVTATLSNKVDTSGFALTYRDVNNNVTASASNLRYVQIQLTLKDATTGFSSTQRSRVAVRNS